jgi:hypothetical protein
MASDALIILSKFARNKKESLKHELTKNKTTIIVSLLKVSKPRYRKDRGFCY